jgi:hypothetical protein
MAGWVEHDSGTCCLDVRLAQPGIDVHQSWVDPGCERREVQRSAGRTGRA